MMTLILGPVRSGKSTRAQHLAQISGKPVIYAATAAFDTADPEMADRVARHRASRPESWSVIETAAPDAPDLAEVIRDAAAGSCILVDALGTWLAALMFTHERDGDVDAVALLAALDAAGDALLAALAATAADVILVAEETGWGVVPASALGRIFRDALGRLAQRIAARADRVELVVAGFAVDLRAVGTRVEERN